MGTMRRNLFECYFLGLVLVLAFSVHGASAAEILTIGGQGQISWQGKVVSDSAVDAIKPEYRSPLDPQVTEIGNTP